MNIFTCMDTMCIIHVYFHIQIIMHHLGISSPFEDGFSKVEISYLKKAYYSLCDNYGVNADQTWMNGGIQRYKVFSDGGKATKWSSSDNLTEKSIGKIRRSVRA